MTFVINSFFLGVGLAMDAFSVSLANGLAEPKIKVSKLLSIAGVFAFFQALMPMLGWLIIRTLEELFGVIVKIVPFAALALLWFIGIRMIISGIKDAKNGVSEAAAVTAGALLVQGVATSIDALSAGLAFSEYGFLEALSSALIIAAVTFVICTIGVLIGKKAGAALAGKATVVGGAILVIIGAEIFIKGIL